jgi:hypothetical protein
MSSSAPSTPFLAAVKDSSNMAAHSPLRSELSKSPHSLSACYFGTELMKFPVPAGKTFHEEQQKKLVLIPGLDVSFVGLVHTVQSTGVAALHCQGFLSTKFCPSTQFFVRLTAWSSKKRSVTRFCPEGIRNRRLPFGHTKTRHSNSRRSSKTFLIFSQIVLEAVLRIRDPVRYLFDPWIRDPE